MGRKILVINKIEMLGYPNLDKNEEAKFNLLIDNSFVHDINNMVIDKTINTKDFEDIEGIKVIALESL